MSPPQAAFCRAATGLLPATALPAPDPRVSDAAKEAARLLWGDGPPLFFALIGGLVVRAALCRVVITAHSGAPTQAQLPRPSPVDV
eukprot:6133316-Pyramimonas_sp.AAC.1